MKVWLLQLATIDVPTTDRRTGCFPIGIPNLGVFSSLDHVWNFVTTDETEMGIDWWSRLRWQRYHDEYFEGWTGDETECVLIYTMEVDTPCE
jgi:hypothetical protein